MDNYDDYFKDGENQDEKLDIQDEPTEFINLSERSRLEANEKEKLVTNFFAVLTRECDKCFKDPSLISTLISKSMFARALDYWLNYYFEFLDTETVADTGMSTCDIMFTLMCKFVLLTDPVRWFINSREARLSLLYHSLYPLSYDLRILACQHTHETLMAWPSNEEYSLLCGRVSQLVSYAMVCDPTVLVDYILKKTQNNYTSLIVLTNDVKQKVASLTLERPETAEEQKQRSREEQAAANGSKELKELMRQKQIQRARMAQDVQVTGQIWNDDLAHVVTNFVPFANAVCHTIQFHNVQYESFISMGYTILNGIEPLFALFPLHLNSFKWKEYRNCFIHGMQKNTEYFSTADVFRKRTENLCYEMVLPLGSRFHHLRAVDTQFTNDLPVQVLENHLGKRTQGWLYHQLGSQKYYQHSLDRTHLFNACILLSMMTYDLRQNKKVHFYKDYFITFTQFYSRYKRITTSEIHDRERCPIVFNMKRRWYVSHKKLIIGCSPEHNEGLIDALTLWCFLMLFDCKGETENYIDLTEWLKEKICDTNWNTGTTTTTSNSNKRQKTN